ncbi:unnamed protein product [Moneuplotes crassus]|uniref:BZIP domain-containing protein n=1 Tax=Euplotes crassus TaxID=5936 RepID=A0AAD1XKP6_EUPCR|nr:unnamed protein product [Moneuplotes crassus]
MNKSAFTDVVQERKRAANELKDQDDLLKQQIKHLSPKTRRKELNKIYCRNRRRNQKDYILGLENRIGDLEAEVAKLQDIIRTKIPLFSNPSMVTSRTVKTKEFKLMENDKSLKVIDDLKEVDESEKIQSSLNKINKSCGTGSDPRKNIINSAIRDIINNMVSSRTRVLLRMIDKGTNASMDDYKRLFVMNINDFENEMKNSKYGDMNTNISSKS